MNCKLLLILASVVVSVSAFGQCRYCNSYEDFFADRWEHLDTVYCDDLSDIHKFWLRGSDYTLTTGDKDLDKKLNQSAFAVRVNDVVFVNTSKLHFEKATFGKGYTQAVLIEGDQLLFVSRLIGKESRKRIDKATDDLGVAFGLIGVGAAIASTRKQHIRDGVCYLISSGTDDKGQITIKMVDDTLMDKLLLSRNLTDLHNKYYAETDKYKRKLAARVLPILKKAGIIE